MINISIRLIIREIMGLFFNRKDPKTELEGLQKAQEILDERNKKGQIAPEVYAKKCLEFQKQREKYEKKLKKQGY